ncbi:MAG TPA: ABC transporter substrate-binding protein, partial [Acetobacteraceae bacterium]
MMAEHKGMPMSTRTRLLVRISASIGARLLALAPLVLASAAFAQQSAGVLRIGSVYQDIGTLDPQFATGSNDRIPSSWIYSALVRFKPGTIDPALIEPDLAERWDISADRLTWTFHLRRGVQFQAG